MQKLASAVIGTVLAGTMMMPAPAAAQSMRSQERYVQQQCYQHPNWRGCEDWRDNRGRWGSNEYSNWYRWNRPNLGNVAAGIFGFAIGAAILGGIARQSGSYSGSDWQNHVDACEARYRSYNPRTDMFLGYDGQYHRCNL